MKSIKILICIGIALFPYLVTGQCISSQEKPEWVDGSFLDLNNSYIECASATGYTEEEARNKAASIIAVRRDWGSGKRVNVQVKNGNVVVDGQESLTVKVRVIDEYREYCENKQYRVSLLVQTAKNPMYDFEPAKVTTNYGFSPRAFVPGMAQLYKGSKTKGVLFIVGEAALIGGVVVAENLRISYNSKISGTHSAADIKSYNNSADNWKNIRNGCIAGAVALYAWNVIDGLVAKGKKRVVILGDNTLKITPYATPYSSGVSLAFNF
jgi:hypothetical protein